MRSGKTLSTLPCGAVAGVAAAPGPLGVYATVLVLSSPPPARHHHRCSFVCKVCLRLALSARRAACRSGGARRRARPCGRGRKYGVGLSCASPPLAAHLRVPALLRGGLADELVRERDEHAAGHRRGDEAGGEVAEVDLDVPQRVLGVLLHGRGFVVARGQARQRLLLLGAARDAAQHVVDDVARDVGHARGGRAARAGAFALFCSACSICSICSICSTSLAPIVASRRSLLQHPHGYAKILAVQFVLRTVVQGSSVAGQPQCLRLRHRSTPNARSLSHSPSAPPPSFTQSPYPPRSLVRDEQTHPHRPRLVVSHSTCPPLSSSPHANSFVIGPAVIKHTHQSHSKIPYVSLMSLLKR
jgi:hypothetical protein